MSENASERDRYFYRESDGSRRIHMIRTADEQAGFLLPHLEPGMSVMDCGCGPGTITVGLAKIVAPGKVVAFDVVEEQVRIARNHAEEAGVANVEFRVADIYEIPFPNDTFDAVYVNAVLEHLNQPMEALKEVRRVLKPSGVVGVRDVDHGGDVVAPKEGHYVTLLDIYVEVWKSPHMGGDPMMGRHLRSFLRRAGFTDVEATASYDVYGNPDTLGVLMGASSEYILRPAYVDQVKALGLTDRETLEEISAGIMELINNPDTFVAIAYCEALGWKD